VSVLRFYIDLYEDITLRTGRCSSVKRRRREHSLIHQTKGQAHSEIGVV